MSGAITTIEPNPEVRTDPVEAGERPDVRGGAPATTSRGESALVLIVEDDVTTRRMMAYIMARVGFRTAGAGSVAEATEAIAADPPDLILLDVGLPDGDGYEVCRRVRAGVATQHTPVLFISASDDAASRVKGFEVGGVDYVGKPINPAELVARVRTHLRLRRAYERLAELQAERIVRLARVQEALLPRPQALPGAGFQVALAQLEMAGGDFYDVVPVGTQAFDYVVADISGHDLASSYWTAALKALMAEYAKPEHVPLEVVQAMNRVFLRVLPAEVHFTAVYARLDRPGRRLSLVTAGHPPAILVSRGEGLILEGAGDVVGGFADAVFHVREQPVAPGDRLFLYSDGLVERAGERDEGIRRLAAACARRSGEPLGQAVSALLHELSGGQRPDDDRVLLGVEV